MTYTTITIGRLVLREVFDLAANISAGTDTRSVVLSGEESYPPLPSIAEVQRRNEDILGLQNRLVPIRFGTKSDHDGWYVITDVNTQPRNYQSGELAAFGWGINAQRIGPENAVDLESRLAGISRINDFGLTGERWHARPEERTPITPAALNHLGQYLEAQATGWRFRLGAAFLPLRIHGGPSR